MRRIFTILVTLLALPAAADTNARFDSIDGGTLAITDWAGQPVLVVNTASLCAFTDQYDGLQALYDRYRDQGLIVLAVPSNDFRQELGSKEEVAEFCELNFDLDLPMTDITHVKGDDAHPFYAWLRQTHGFQPRWNFNKVLIGPDGSVQATFGSPVKPLSKPMTQAIEAQLR